MSNTRFSIGKRGIDIVFGSLLLAGLSTQAFAFSTVTVGGGACNYHSIQDAINAATDPEGNSIFVASDSTYSSQRLTITNRNVNILAGYEHCDSQLPTGQTQISGTTGSSVIEIEGTSNVYISNLVISGGNLDGSHRGGGIFFGGGGTLTLASVKVLSNRAGAGGGISMAPSASATLSLIGTLIDGNVGSVEGGGIRIEGHTTLDMDVGSIITSNSATGTNGSAFGGGLEVIGPATANLRGNFNSNSAAYGGGVAALASGSGDTATVNLYANTPGGVGTIYNNHAGFTGGGVYLKGSRDGARAYLCASSFQLSENTASNGAALYAEQDSGNGSTAYFNNASASSPECAPPSDLVQCAGSPGCNEIFHNVNSDTSANSAVMIAQTDGQIFANRFIARANQSSRLMELFADSDEGALVVNECVIADNVLRSNLLWAFGGGADTVLFVHSCTISNNTLGVSDPVIYADAHSLEIDSSIIDQPAQSKSYDTSSAVKSLDTNYVLTNNTSAFTHGGADILQGTPLFVNAAGGDYHQQRTSPGVDVAPPNGDAVDLDGNPRVLDLNDRPNEPGPMDLGAYEIQTQGDDTIFRNGFEP